jgi:hypothetical protein
MNNQMFQQNQKNNQINQMGQQNQINNQMQQMQAQSLTNNQINPMGQQNQMSNSMNNQMGFQSQVGLGNNMSNNPMMNQMNQGMNQMPNNQMNQFMQEQQQQAAMLQQQQQQQQQAAMLAQQTMMQQAMQQQAMQQQAAMMQQAMLAQQQQQAMMQQAMLEQQQKMAQMQTILNQGKNAGQSPNTAPFGCSQIVQPQGNGISVIFRTSGQNAPQRPPISIQCMPDEKVSTLIERYRNKADDHDQTKKFIFNAKNLNQSYLFRQLVLRIILIYLLLRLKEFKEQFKKNKQLFS